MRTRLAGFLASVSTSPGDRRALESLINDWRFESRQSRGVVTGVLVFARWSAALSITLVRLAVRDAGRIDTWLSVAVAVSLAVMLSVLSLLVWRPPPGPQSHPAILVWQLPSSIALLLAPALTIVLSATRRTALLGAGALAATMMVVLVGWLVPESNQQYRVRTFAAFGGTADFRRGEPRADDSPAPQPRGGGIPSRGGS